MCSHYQTLRDAARHRHHFGAELPAQLTDADVWPGLPGSFVRRPREADSGDDAVPAREALAGVFGLLPHWAKDQKFARHTYNARSETVHEKPSFRDAWKRAQHCIVAADAIFEPDWRSGKAIATRIARADGEPMGLAGLWSSWKSPAGEIVHSFTMLTINADGHELMRHMHRPTDEKRMVVVLPESRYDAWLAAGADEARDFLRQFPADRLRAEV